MVLLQMKDPMELFGKGREFLPGSRFVSYAISPRLLKMRRKNQFLPFFLTKLLFWFIKGKNLGVLMAG